MGDRICFSFSFIGPAAGLLSVGVGLPADLFAGCFIDTVEVFQLQGHPLIAGKELFVSQEEVPVESCHGAGVFANGTTGVVSAIPAVIAHPVDVFS